MFSNGIFSEGFPGGAEKAVFEFPTLIDPSSPLLPREGGHSGYRFGDLGAADDPRWSH